MTEDPEREAEVEAPAVEWHKRRMKWITASISSQWEATGPLMAMCK